MATFNANHNNGSVQKVNNTSSLPLNPEKCMNIQAGMQYQYEKNGSAVHGNIYQLKLLMLFLKRGLSRKYSFRLGTEVRQADKFDDLVFEYTQNNKKVYRLLQAKHKLDESKKITAENLFTNNTGDYNLIKYFLSYDKCKRNPLFRDGTIKDVTVCTNINFDFNSLESARIKIKKVESTDDILDVESTLKPAARYKFSNDVASLLKTKLGSAVHSLNEISDFLNHLVFAVNQPNENELEMILKQEIGKVFDFVTTENVYNKLFMRMLNWLQGKEGATFLSYKEGEQFFQEAMKGVAIFYDIKTPVKSFTGRTHELDDLHNMLQDENKVPQFVCICGLGGVGKTELAKKYVSLYSKSYDNKIVWINADNYESLAESFCRLASDKLNINTKNANGYEKDIHSIVEDIYIFFSKHKSLFIFDNAGKHSSREEFDGVAKFLPSLPLEGNELHVLITSRNRNWPKHFKVLDLNVFNESEAVDFLKNSLNTRNNTEMSYIRDLAVLLDFMPLALQQAVSYINVRDTNFKNLRLQFTAQSYIDAYEEKKKEHLNFYFFENSDSNYTKTVFTTWNVTLEMMSQMEHGNNALEILNIASYLAADNIPTHLFYELLTDPEQLGSAISLLSLYSLIIVENGMFGMHRLVQQVIRMKIQEQNLEPQVLERAFKLLTRDNITTKTIPHALSVWNHSESHNDLVSVFSSILCDISCVLFENERYEDALDFDKWVLVKLNALLKKGVNVLKIISGTKFNIATLVRRQGKYDIALEILQEVVDTEMNFQNDIEFIVRIKSTIALTLLEQGKYNEALKYYEEVRAYEDTLGSDHLEMLHIRSGMAIALSKKGQAIEGLEKLKQVSNIQEETLGKNHSITISTKITFANTLIQEQKLDEGLEVLIETYNTNVKALGKNHRTILRLMHHIGSAYVNKKDFNRALQWYNDVITAEEETTQGKNDPFVLNIRCSVAEIFSFQGKYDEALEMCQDVFVQQNSILGAQHPHTIRAQRILGEIYGDQGDYNKAEEILKEVLHKCKITFDNCHSNVSNTLKALEIILVKQEKFDEALQYIEQRLDIEIKTCGENHLRTLNIQNLLGVVQYRQRNYDKALEILRKTLDTLQRLYPHDNLIQMVKVNIGLVYSEQNHHDDTLRIFSEVHLDREATLGKDHFETANIKEHKALVLFEQNKEVDKALKLLQEVHTVYNDVLGSQHSRTLMIGNFIQKSLKLNNDLITAVRKSNTMIIQRLIDSGADVNTTDNDGESPLHYAVNNDKTPIAHFLLHRGANIMQLTKKGNTSLHIAVSQGSLEMVDVLLQHAKSNDQLSDFIDARTTTSGSSALHHAAKHGFIKIVKLLLINGATYNIKNKKNNIPFTVSKNHDIAKLLQLIEELFQDAKSGDISISKKLQALTYDTLLAVTNARDKCKTVTQVSIVNNHKNIAQVVIQTLRDARERCPPDIVSRYSGRKTVCSV